MFKLKAGTKIRFARGMAATEELSTTIERGILLFTHERLFENFDNLGFSVLPPK